MQEQHAGGERKPHTREYIDSIHRLAHLWTAESRAIAEYERAMDEFGIPIPKELPPSVPTLFERYRQATVTAVLIFVGIFLYSWGVL